jgi:hypothetical protein
VGYRSALEALVRRAKAAVARRSQKACGGRTPHRRAGAQSQAGPPGLLRFFGLLRRKIGPGVTSGAGSQRHLHARYTSAYSKKMDTRFVDQALETYRAKTGDLRPWDLLPVATTSDLLRDAQHLKAEERPR